MLSYQERYYLQHRKHEIVTEIVKKNPIQPIKFSQVNEKNFLAPNIQVKAMFWFFRDQIYEDGTDNRWYLHRYNYSCFEPDVINPVPVEKQGLYPVMSDAKLVLNGHDTLGFLDTSLRNSIHTANYYKYVQPLQHSLLAPSRNIYTYSFSLNPKDTVPTGFLNFSIIESSKSFIEVYIINIERLKKDPTRVFNMHLYLLGYQALVFENGFMGIKYSTS